MKWREATMAEALGWAAGKSVMGPANERPFDEWDAVKLSDGSVVACMSGSTYNTGTEYTPEEVSQPPQWRIGVPQ